MEISSGSLRNRLFGAFALITVLAAGLPVFLYRDTLYGERLESAGKQASAHAVFAKTILESRPDEEAAHRLFGHAGEFSLRLTQADVSDRVTRDSHISPANLPQVDNHGDRPEILEAHAKGTGVAVRRSNTLGLEAVYAAVALADGGTVRVAVPVADIRNSFQTEFASVIPVVIGVTAFCLLLSVLIATHVRGVMNDMAEMVASIAQTKGQRRLHTVSWREFLPLAYAVNHMADNIEEHVHNVDDRQSQLETILESMSEGVLVLGPSGNIRRWNKALVALFPHIAAVEGKALIEGLPIPALQQRVDELLRKRAADNAAPAADSEAVHFQLPVGRFLTANLASPGRRTDALGVVIVVSDVTEIMRLERVRRDFVSNVSHELRTPLTAVAGYAETLMLSDDLQTEYRNFAGIIHKHAAVLSGIINDLLELARLEDVREAVTLRPTDAGEILGEILENFREIAEAKKLSFETTLADTPVLADAPLLARVFGNLLENACRYSPLGGAVRILSKREGQEVTFIVSDNGPGIPKEALPRIFERFYQVKKERNSGTAGIGLAVCKHIIERHRGRIWAESPYKDASAAILFTLAPAETGNFS